MDGAETVTASSRAPGSSLDPGDPGPAPSGYRPFLDGVRAVAVYLVVLFHAGVDRFLGGFIGVDVFFVLSGYLVTQLLVRDIEAHGSIRLSRFYARRFRRLLPASFLALVATAAVVTVVLSPAEVVAAIDSFRASFLYWANWYFIDQSADYFGDKIGQSPVLHFWSLAVEEQFYLLWPLLLGAIVWFASRLSPTHRWTTARIVVGVACLASVTWALVLSTSAPNRAYYGTDTRAYQLLLGALLALTPQLVRRARALGRVVAPATVAALAGLLVLASWVIAVGPVKRGVAVSLLTAVLVVGLEASAGRGVLARALSRPTLVYLGKISYGTYLWHWPVIIVVGRLVDIGDLAMAAVAAGVATALAALSYVLVEVPVRENRFMHRFAPVVVGAGLAISLVSALVVIPRIMDPTAARAGGEGTAATARVPVEVPTDFDQVEITSQGIGEEALCVNAPPQACTVRTGGGAHVLLVGDSTAVMMSAAFETMAERADLTLSLAAHRGCSWIEGYNRNGQDDERCDRRRADLYDRVLPALAPDLVVAMDVRPADSLSSPAFDDDPARNAEVRRQVSRSVDRLTAGGRHLVILEPLPRTADLFDPLSCLATEASVPECRFRAPADDFWLEWLQRELASEQDDVWTVDLDRAVCPRLPVCDPVVGDTVVWWDAAHITQGYAQGLVGDLLTELRARGLLAPS